MHCSWKSHIYIVTKFFGDLLSEVHFVCVVFFCCPAIAFVKLITLGWIYIFFIENVRYFSYWFVLADIKMWKEGIKLKFSESDWATSGAVHALCTRCARKVIFNGSLPTFSLWPLSQVQRWQSSHFNSSKILRRHFPFFST